MDIQNNNDNLLLSIMSAIGSVASFFIAFVTDYRVMGVLGFVMLCLSGYASYLTIKERRISIKEKKMSIEQMKKHNKF